MPFAELRDCRLWYQWEGDAARPTILLSNSLGADLSMWDAQMPALLEHYRVLRYDTRGHGKSGVPDGPYSIAMLGADVVGLLDTLGLERVSFCGVSMGGMTGMWLGVHAADRLTKLVLSNTAARIGSPESWQERIDQVERSGMQAIVEGVLSRWFTPGFLQDEARLQPQREMLLRCPPQGYTACCAAIAKMDQSETVTHISVPTLVISGTVDPVTPPASGRELEVSIPGARYEEVPGAHLANIEQPDRYNDVLLRFLTAD